jgi:hypothetical protein
MAVFQFRMNAGIPGDISRPEQATVITETLDTTNYPTVYGVAGTIDATSKKFRKIMAGDTASSVYGLYVRPFPTTTGQLTDGLGTSTPPTAGVCNVMKRGFMTVQLNNTTAAAKNGTVYVRTATGTGSIIGGFEAAADSTNTFVLANAYFTGPADASGNVEIAFNL